MTLAFIKHAQDAPPDGHNAATPVPPAHATLAGRIEARTATIAVVGLGYVGLPLLIASADQGFKTIGYDADEGKIASLCRRHSYVGDVADEQLARIERAVFTADPTALRSADVIIVAVPTPLRGGMPDLGPLTTAGAAISAALAPGQLVILESTSYPGTTQEIFQPLLEASGLQAGRDFALAYSPERIDPGSGRTLRQVPKIVAGVTPEDTEIAALFYETIVDQVVRTKTPREAEMAKLIENTFRQVNIALVNELATIAPALGVDLWAALDAAATKPFGYMPFWPGPGVGGHCIAIDPSYLSWKVEQQMGFGIGFVEHARAVNNRMPAHVVGRIAEALNDRGSTLRGARLLILGLSYKPGVGDVRESPALSVLQRLLATGADCEYHDPHLPVVCVGGRRATDLVRGEPHDPPLSMRSVLPTTTLIQQADCVVILTAHPEVDYREIVANARLVFDAVGVTRGQRASNVVLL